ncbi:MAG: N-acetylmuramoyl-L-alanine amidase [Bacillota bacterium]|nr:N-acetylmuramoyl-L-alanine amidase [Bacillota bacterium]
MSKRYDYSLYGKEPSKGGGSGMLLPAILFVIVLLLALILYKVATREPDETPSTIRRTTTVRGTDMDGTGSEASGKHVYDEEPTTTEDPNRIQILNDEPEPTRVGEFLKRWPADSAIENLHDARGLMESLGGRPDGPTALQGVTVILDPGHGGIDGGTVYPASPPHTHIEKDIVLDLARRTRAVLEGRGAEVVMTRDSDEWFSIYHRAAQAGQLILDRTRAALAGTPKTTDWLDEMDQYMAHIRSLNQDRGGGSVIGGAGTQRQARELYDLQRQYPEVIFLSLHINSFTDPAVGGLQVYYLTNESYYNYEAVTVGGPDPNMKPVYQNYDSDARYNLAMAVVNTLSIDVPETKTVGGPQPLISDRGFVVLKCMGLNTVLVEVGYMTNPDDRVRLQDPAYLDRLAAALGRSVYQYFCQ